MKDIVEVIRCKNCEYGEQDEENRWFCRALGCQMGDINGNGFCSNAEAKEGRKSEKGTFFGAMWCLVLCIAGLNDPFNS